MCDCPCQGCLPLVCLPGGLRRRRRPLTRSPAHPLTRPSTPERAQDFGARDATAGELESNFSEKVLGNFDTEHVIRPPEQMGDLIGLKNKRCESCEGGAVALLDEAEVNRLQLQCAGWRVRDNAAGVQCLACDWKVRNFTAGLELFSRIAALAEDEGHHPDLHLTGYSNVTAELTTHSVGGLTTNDFIMAAKINELELADLQPRVKPKYWA